MTDPVLEISAARFAANLAAVRSRIAPAQLMLVVKDDAYGHGLDWTIAAAADTAWFGGYDIPSALRLRAGTDARIFAWAPSTRPEVDAAVEGDIDLGVGSREYLATVSAAAERLGRRARVHLKIDTGLHRNGIRPEEWQDAVGDARRAQRAGLLEVVGVWSHLAEASDAEDDESARLFAEAADAWDAAAGRPALRHLTASAASWWRPELRGDLCRIGAFVYGVRSAEGPRIPGVEPVAALRAAVIAVDDETATVALGAADGIPSTLRGLPVGTPGGVRELIDIGMSVSRVAAWPGAAPGQRVTIFGRGEQGEADATALAERIGTVGEEILTRLTPRVRRVATG